MSKPAKDNIEMDVFKRKDSIRSVGKTVKAPDSCYGARHTQIILLFFLLAIGYGMRVNLSVAIVAMTDPKANPDFDFPTYDWHNKSVILSSFFWGYILPQIVAGQVAKKYGPRWFLAGSMTICSIFSILLPFMAAFGSWGVILSRVIQGFGQGFFFPSTHNLLGKWAPLPERSRLGTFVFAGGPFGTVISMPLTGWISGSSLGWPFAFYLYGILGMVWVFAFLILNSNSPAEHTTMDPEERDYIETSLNHDHLKKNQPTPWKKIATSLPVWAIFITHCAQNWGFWTLLTEIPTYMSQVLYFDIQSNGVLSACPYFTMWVMSFVFSAFTDYIINNGYASIGVGRKIANSIGLYVPAIALIVLGVTGSSENRSASLAISLLIIALGANAAHMCGYQVNHIDLSPTHAGTLMGITNGFSNICSLIGPLFVQYIVTDDHDANLWKIVFFVAAGFSIVGNTFFVAFGSGEIQLWDSCESEHKDTESSGKPEKRKDYGCAS